MEQKKLQAAIEAILFAMGGSVELKKLAQAIGHDEETTKKIIRQMMDRYEKEDRGIRIIELEASFQMCTKKEMYEYLIRVAKQPKKQVLTDVLLETLSIIAYKQPVTKADIEKIRGVKSDHAVNRLVEYDLVYEAGRLDAPGRPALFATTEEFLRRFGVGSTEQLPEMNVEQREEIRSEVEEELNLKIDEEGHLIDEPEKDAGTAEEPVDSETGMEKTEENESGAIISDTEIEKEIESEDNSETDEEDSIS
mgnify:CR=1 FL=1